MKINFLSLVFFVLFLNCAFSQEGYFINNEGEKTIVDNNTVTYNDANQKFEYELPGSDKKIRISLDKITSARLGNYRVETFAIEDKPRAYFILIDKPGKKLVGYTVDNSNGDTDFFTKYFYYILDENNKLLETLKARNERQKDKNNIEGALEKYFSDCSEVLKKLDPYNSGMYDSKNIPKRVQKNIEEMREDDVRYTSLFKDPMYLSCDTQKTGVPMSELTNNNKLPVSTTIFSADLSQYDGKFTFASFTNHTSHGFNGDMKIGGSFIIKDGYVNIVSKGYEAKYKITNIKDGMIYLEDKAMIHTLKIIPETGTKKGAAYDTKLVFGADKAMGFTAEYWCIKQ